MEIKTFKELKEKIIESKDRTAEYRSYDDFIVVDCDFVYKENCCEYKRVWFHEDGSVEINQMEESHWKELNYISGITFEKMSWNKMYQLYLIFCGGKNSE